MAIDRNRSHVLRRGRIIGTRWRWLIRLVTVSVGIASLIVFVSKLSQASGIEPALDRASR